MTLYLAVLLYFAVGFCVAVWIVAKGKDIHSGVALFWPMLAAFGMFWSIVHALDWLYESVWEAAVERCAQWVRERRKG